MAAIFNTLNLLQLGVLVRRHRELPHLDIFLIGTVCLLAMLGYYVWALYRQTRNRLNGLPDDSIEAHTLLCSSYRRYRLYLTGLAFGFVILGIFSIALR